MSAELTLIDRGALESFPQVDFPFKFYDFMREASVSHPKVVAWSDCGKFFRVDRRSPELPALLRKHFKHSKYESLRRQMNSYGFFINKSTDWWNLKSGYFCRDNPQLNKILPRPRSTRPMKNDSESVIVSDKKVKSRERSNSPASETADESSLGPTKNPTRLSSTLKSQVTKVHEKLKQTYGKESYQTQKTSKRDLEDYSEKEDTSTTFKKLRNRTPHGTFPELLHKFICECSVSHPDVVSWNLNRTAFNVEIHHPTLPKLLSKYFQHENYQSLRRQLNFYGFRRDEEGYYRNNIFRYGHYDEVTNCNLRIRTKKSYSISNTVERVIDEPGDDDSDELSPLFDFDLSTYATMRTDEMNFEQVDNQDLRDKTFDDGRMREVDKMEIESPKFKVLQKVYVCDKDGVMYLATIRRHLYGPQNQKQIDMGLVLTKDEVCDSNVGDDPESSWHYFVHYDSWNVNFDKWVSENDILAVTDNVVSVAERISKEHRSLQLEMRKNVKGKKLFQTIEGTAFLREWKKRLQLILAETNFKNDRNISDEQLNGISHETHTESGEPSKKNMKRIAWTHAAITNEKVFREQGLTAVRTQSNSIVLPFVLKKILVQQWEYINQCRMIPCIPASVTIRHALNMYLASKNIEWTASPSHNELHDGVHLSPLVIAQDGNESSEDCNLSEKGISNPDGLPTKDRDQEWRDMADGIAMLFDEALESRLLYREELPQLRSIHNVPEYSRTPYSEMYGCEHLLRLFVRLPEMLSDNLPDAEVRPIIAKVNDFIRFLHKNQASLLTQTHRKLNESELKEQQQIRDLDPKV